MRLRETLVKAIAMLCRCLRRGTRHYKHKDEVGCCCFGACYGRCWRVNGPARGIFDGAKFRFHHLSRAAGWAVLTGSDIYEVQNPRSCGDVYPPRDGVGLCRVAEGVSVDGDLAASSMT